MLQKILFPAPQPPDYSLESHESNLIWIPPTQLNQQPIPCMFYEPTHSRDKSNNLIIFSHGNACDIGSMFWTCKTLSERLDVYILSFEYPGYGLSRDSAISETTINEYGNRAYEFVLNELKWPPQRVIIYGQSIGTGVACYLASTKNVAGLILHSPFSSIYDVVKFHAGKFISFVVAHRWWYNERAIVNVTGAVLLIHGTEDKVIPSEHSKKLHENCDKSSYKRIVLLKDEDHNTISECTLIRYIKPFIDQINSTNHDVVSPKIDIKQFRAVQDPKTQVSSSSTGFLKYVYGLSRASTTATKSVIGSITSCKNDNEE